MSVNDSLPTLDAAVAFARSRQSQPAIPWPVQAWADAFPSHKGIFGGLPGRLDRGVIQRFCADQTHDADGAVRAFLASMAWGYGRVGYGPFRASQVLNKPNAATKLAHARAEVLSGGPLAGYRALAGPDRLEGLGPAFGTKYLYFQNSDALILDSLIGDWYHALSGIDPKVTTWDSARYAAYVAYMQLWAEKGHVRADDLEAAVFTLLANDRTGSQWRTTDD
jgi:hypothetical protein